MTDSDDKTLTERLAGPKLPPGRHGLERDTVLRSQRGRLLSAFVELSAEQGFHAVTIIDVVTRAGTSKRTFYEHFADKEACLVQAFDLFKTMLIDGVIDRIAEIDQPLERIQQGIRAYLETLMAMPNFARLFLNESMSSGHELAALSTAAADQFAAAIVERREQSREQYPDVPPLTPHHALVVILGLNELISLTVHRDGVDKLADLTDELTELATKLLLAE